MMQNTLVVIVNYKVGALCVDTLRSIEGQVDADLGSRVIVVDNASCDQSDDHIERAIEENGWSSWARLIRSPVNGGFAAGNNFGIDAALETGPTPTYVHLLNPDTVARDGALPNLWSFMEQHPEIGIAGSRLDNEDGTQHQSRYRFPSLLSEVESRLGLGIVTRALKKHVVPIPLVPLTERVDWLAGASMMIRWQVFEDIGRLDDGYFMYFEEVDFCLRAKNAGWPCWFVNESRVSHLVGRSSGINVTSAVLLPLPRYWFQSRRRFWVRNHGYVFALLVDAVAISCDAVRRLRLLIQRRPDNQPKGFLLDMVRVGFSRGERGTVPSSTS